MLSVCEGGTCTYLQQIPSIKPSRNTSLLKRHSDEAFLRQKPIEVIDNAIRKFQEKKAAWRSLRDKFFEQMADRFLRTAMTLLEQIQNEAVDGNSDLATALRKCLVLAARLKNQEFTDWVNHELNGYSEDAIPEYRILFGHCHGNFLGGGGAALSNVPLLEGDIDSEVRDRLVTVRLRAGVTALQLMLDHAREQGGIYKVSWPAGRFIKAALFPIIWCCVRPGPRFQTTCWPRF